MRDNLNHIIKSMANYQPSLCPSSVRDSELDKWIADLSIASLTTGNRAQEPYAMAVKSGLHLWNESLDASHTLSQSIENQTGSYWHGIMHRMEGDYSNAKYWFRLVGTHPVFTELQIRVRCVAAEQTGGIAELSQRQQGWDGLLTAADWKPNVMIELIESHAAADDSHSKTAPILRSIQHQEILLLLQYSYQHSCGGTLFEG